MALGYNLSHLVYNKVVKFFTKSCADKMCKINYGAGPLLHTNCTQLWEAEPHTTTPGLWFTHSPSVWSNAATGLMEAPFFTVLPPTSTRYVMPLKGCRKTEHQKVRAITMKKPQRLSKPPVAVDHTNLPHSI